MEDLTNYRLKTIGSWLVAISVIGVFVLPSIEFSSQYPKIEVSDITFIPLFLISIFHFKTDIISFFEKNKWVVITFLILIIVAAFSILFNGRYMVYRDWFEPIKFFKLLSFIFFFYVFIDPVKWKPLIRFVFGAVLIFNFCHYIDLFEFNKIVSPNYTADHHINLFGLNSIGESATKRMFGTLGNPNNNAVMFLIFLIFFIPKSILKVDADLVYTFLAIWAMIACQSRTSIVVLILTLIVFAILYRFNLKSILFYVLTFVGGLIFFQYMGNSYLGSLSSVDVLHSATYGRLEQWIRILHVMPGHWLFGHGVNKEYLELNGIHAESEYFLILFRYGIAGLIALASFWLLLIKKSYDDWKNGYNILLVGTILIFVVVGLTNVPLHSNKLSLMLVLAIGLGLSQIDGREKV